jgi:cellulose synthase/poly-beta-1,6-N-acetylglucosamine synthase-like glycosyltransferase
MSSLDLILVGLYFAVMAVLSLYGLHRYYLIYLYYRYRAAAQGEPAKRFTELPRVTVQLPIYNERFVVEQLLESACRIDYPRELLQIQVLDDSTDETQQIARRKVERLAGEGFPIEYHFRSNRVGYKAGALEAGLSTATGDLIAIFDADFTPPRNFLRDTVDYFTDKKVGAVQARWTYRNRDSSLLTRLQALLLDGHFVFEHGARARSGRFFNFNGTAGILRKSAIEDAGGWQHDTLTEDTELSYRAQLRGWKFIYAPHVEVESELPVDMASFQVQQARWAKGLIQTAIKLLPRIVTSAQPWRVKLEAFVHLTANISYPLMLLLSALVLPSMLVRFYHWEGQLLWLDLPVFLATLSSLSSFYVLAQSELGRGGFRRHALLVPMMVATGIGLTISNSRAVLEAIIGFATPFERTAKYSADRKIASIARQKYGERGGWRAAANLAAGLYFAVSLVLSMFIGSWLTIPFLGLFLVGYAFPGVLMVRQSKARPGALLAVARDPAP